MIRKVIKNCVPAIIALTLTGLYSIIDGLFVGYASSDIGLAAINLAWPIPALFTAIGIGIGTGGSILYSTELGKGRSQKEIFFLQMTVKTCFYASIILGIVLWFLCELLMWLLGAEGEVLTQAVVYCRVIIIGGIFQVTGAGIIPIMRNMEKPVQAMLIMICGMLVNLVMNSILILGYGLGICGAAIGTIAAQFVVVIIGIFRLKKAGFYFLKGKTVWRDCAKILSTGFPAFGISLAPTITLMFTNWRCMQIGGSAMVAAYAVVSYIVFPVQSLLQGVGDGLQPIMSFFYGAGETDKLNQLKKNAFLFLGILSVTSAAASILCRNELGGWFRLSKAADALCKEGIEISSITFLFHGYNRFRIAYLNASLHITRAAVMICVECLIVSPLLLLIMSRILGMYGIWWSLPTASVCMLLVYYLMKEIGEKIC